MNPQVYLHHRVGDLIFCRDKGLLSTALRIGQEMISGGDAPFSHVAICVSPGLILHSTPLRGVHIIGIEEEHPEQIHLRHAKQETHSVLRICRTRKEEEVVFSSILSWTGQGYNYRIWDTKQDSGLDKSYCSQVVARILKDARRLPACLDDNTLVTPSGLYHAVASCNAENVTQEYIDYATYLDNSRDERKRLTNSPERKAIRTEIERSLEIVRVRAIIGSIPDKINANTNRLLNPYVPAAISEGRKVRLETTFQDLGWALRSAKDIIETDWFNNFVWGHWIERRERALLLKRRPLPEDINQKMRILKAELSGVVAEISWLNNALNYLKSNPPGRGDVAEFLRTCRTFLQGRMFPKIDEAIRGYPKRDDLTRASGRLSNPQISALLEETIDALTIVDQYQAAITSAENNITQIAERLDHE